MPTTGVAQWTCAVRNLGFIYIYGTVNDSTSQSLNSDKVAEFCSWINFIKLTTNYDSLSLVLKLSTIKRVSNVTPCHRIHMQNTQTVWCTHRKA